MSGQYRDEIERLSGVLKYCLQMCENMKLWCSEEVKVETTRSLAVRRVL